MKQKYRRWDRFIYSLSGNCLVNRQCRESIKKTCLYKAMFRSIKKEAKDCKHRYRKFGKYY